MKKVSVIVLSYKSSYTIVQTLDSIKKQTYSNIELIITDDCSTDNTLVIINKWIADNQGCLNEIKLVTAEQNTGIPGNINRAMKHVTGDYIKLIAADDYMSPDAIEEYVAFSEQNAGQLPIAKVHLFSESGHIDEAVQMYCDRCYAFAQLSRKEQYSQLLIQNRIVAPSASFYPTQLIRQVGGYDEHFKWFEDYPMNLKVMHEGFGFGLINKELVYYRQSDNSITATQMKRLKKTEMMLFFRIKMGYMIQNGMAWEALKQSRSWIKIALQR